MAAKKPCVWVMCDDWENEHWDTGCGQEWCFMEDGPKENNQRYCGYCGGRIVIRKKRPADGDARSRFVEAMVLIRSSHITAVHDGEASVCPPCDMLRQAVDAFADAECGMENGLPNDPVDSWCRDHATCRAALRKECGVASRLVMSRIRDVHTA